MVPELIKKCKSKIEPYEKDIILVIIIVLVALISFGLGRLSKIGEGREPITIENIDASEVGLKETEFRVAPAAETRFQNEQEKLFVASKNGTKYHYPWCPGALNIKEENKIWFSSKEQAESSGYTPAGNCKGL